VAVVSAEQLMQIICILL